MASTYKLKTKLGKQEQTELFVKLAKAISSLRNPEEVANFLRDMLSEAEVLMLARRLQVAELLIAGSTYESIRQKYKISFSTIARVQTWLETYGTGYRTVIQRINKNDQGKQSDNGKTFTQLKRRYPMYFWPDLLLKEIVKSANQRERQRLLKIVEQMKEKTVLSKELSRMLNKS